jgi:chromosome segregation ATPase
MENTAEELLNELEIIKVDLELSVKQYNELLEDYAEKSFQLNTLENEYDSLQSYCKRIKFDNEQLRKQVLKQELKSLPLIKKFLRFIGIN